MTAFFKTNKPKNLVRRVVFISHFVQISLMFGLIKKTAVSHTYFCHHQSVTISYQTASRKFQGTPMTE